MNSYAEIYTQQGLKNMIENIESKIKSLEKERDSVGKTWTKSKIECHKRTVNAEIVETTEELKELQEALSTRIELDLR